MTTLEQRLAGLRDRGQTYAFVLGIVTAMLVLALGLPLVLGERIESVGGATTALATDPIGPAGDGSGPAGGDLAVDPSTGAPVGAAPDGSALAPGSAGGGPTTTIRGGGAVAPRPTVPGGGSANLTASDQGVTPTTIKVGIVVTDLGGTAALGLKTSSNDPDKQKALFDTQIKVINDRGGFAGRKIVPVYRTIDILSTDSMRTACQGFSKDDKVFAVLHILGVYGDPILCFTQQEKLPYIAWDGAVLDYYGRSNGYLVTAQPSTRRTSLDMVRRLVQAGELKGKKVGILRYAEYVDEDMKALVAYTQQQGNEVTDAEISVSNTGAVPSQLAVAVNRFQAAGVDEVFLMTNTLYGQQFVSQAERQQYFPAYSVSDFDYTAAGNSFLSGMPSSFFRRALLVTSTRIGDTSLTEQVDRDCTSPGGKALTQSDPDFYGAIASCGLLRILGLGLEKAGANPTRPSLVGGMRTVGTFANAGFGTSSLAPAKQGAASAVRMVQADAGCKCWKPVTAFGPTGFNGS